MKLGDIVREYRESQGLSQRGFAEKCGLTNGTIASIENGKNPHTGKPIEPSQDTVKKIADGLGITVHELLKKSDNFVFGSSQTNEPIYERPGMQALFNAAKDATDEDIQMMLDMLEIAKRRSGK